ncbi:MAG: hypothetical protein QOI06_492 [Nocardioidaceae bacterium]|nr:hypothetical protein [Nocardioidaceae bacterium]
MNEAQQAAVAAVRRRLRGVPMFGTSPEETRVRVRYGPDSDPVTDWPRSAAGRDPVAAVLVAATRKA